jgi:dihydroorotase-like cyclic amidohydrolase
MLTEVNNGKLTLSEIVKYMSEGPAKVWNMYPQKGSLHIGADGDLTIVDMKKEDVIRAEDLHSKSKLTPFDGWKIKGKPIYTIVGGRIVMEKGEIYEDAGRGRFIKPLRGE